MQRTKPFDLETYLTEGVEHFVKGAIRATFKDPRGSLFLAGYGASVKKAAGARHRMELLGEHIPSFLIASITQDCNLSCAGCYAHANHSCGGEPNQLSADEWGRVFDEAEALGVAMILLAGGEPLVRRDVIEKAAEKPAIAFPVFTNGTMLDKAYMDLFERRRNLVPIVSIEGDEAATDARRGAGVYGKTQQAMARLKENGLLFGASITVTQENLKAVTSPDFVQDLRDKGCKVLLFIEYVPVDERDIALTPAQQALLDEQVAALRSRFDELIIVSFPGDEKEAGGCLAAGRGFIHINAAGGAEPCPFSPYSDTNVRQGGLRQALKSPLFGRLKDTGVLQQEHTGGCVLFYRQEDVRQLVGEGAAPGEVV